MIFTKFDAVEIDPLDIKELFKIFISFYIVLGEGPDLTCVLYSKFGLKLTWWLWS